MTDDPQLTYRYSASTIPALPACQFLCRRKYTFPCHLRALADVCTGRVTTILTSRFLLDLQEANRRCVRMVPAGDAGRLSPDVYDNDDRPLSFSEEVASFGTIIFATDDETAELSGAEEPSTADLPAELQTAEAQDSQDVHSDEKSEKDQ